MALLTASALFSPAGLHAQGYTVSNLVADLPGAANIDTNLVNAWGLAILPKDMLIVNANENSIAGLYGTDGKPTGSYLAVNSAPSGLAVNRGGVCDYFVAGVGLGGLPKVQNVFKRNGQGDVIARPAKDADTVHKIAFIPNDDISQLIASVKQRRLKQPRIGEIGTCREGFIENCSLAIGVRSGHASNSRPSFPCRVSLPVYKKTPLLR